jgi:hypothetical protein
VKLRQVSYLIYVAGEDGLYSDAHSTAARFPPRPKLKIDENGEEYCGSAKGMGQGTVGMPAVGFSIPVATE